MNLFRIIILAGSTFAFGGASYLSYSGVWRESRDAAQSVRVGSSGGGYNSSGRIK
ncbi:hypothetical protein [Parasulfitobacter algicola]|uniref:Uncharacterized protein n=1 Tax=Parasulfitobacter algicola TaxID=2614809 RepID=A0ABX2IKD3_9RHOB|nr:hypothetical protein [Sulfitobacter algicola]NSX53339.1 hypothetical protein [Sulfitobacter algicola]